MPAYASFKSLADYLDQRCHRDKINHMHLSEAIGAQPNYIHCVSRGQFSPSRARADRIAEFFHDDPHVVRVLAGLEAPPPQLADRQLREINDLAVGLNEAGRRQAIHYLRYLADSAR